MMLRSRRRWGRRSLGGCSSRVIISTICVWRCRGRRGVPWASVKEFFFLLLSQWRIRARCGAGGRRYIHPSSHSFMEMKARQASKPK
ncbi:hypothetical protein M422DRAFT_783595 [Sphaerobolus stellatus SS14]|uniref:Unplaced genomic scaffold SPHSTscaffold_157, whole genome shotgun sequence n=1 Tax=Sphaerobolus stellatus (strain SS14) TaxID=990650 RepID=A0A0C9V3N4_SPHS4|nr:hypothetical protein M422DRAFT_783595 [Sphaerobolus stellatus SS14]